MNKDKVTINKAKKIGTRAKFKLCTFFIFHFSFFIFLGCSSAPAKVTEIFTIRNTAASQLNLANQTASHGQYENALIIVEGARQLAVSTDDPSLIIRTLISRGNILFSLGRRDEAFKDWENAVQEAEVSRETILAAQARIFIIRASIVMLETESNAAATTSIEEYKANLSREMTAVRADSFSTAIGYVTLGLAEKELGRWAEAENAVRRALDIHERDLNLEEAAYDWFLIGSIRSMAGNYETALQALRTAISFDRRAENGFGLASSWQAMGDVYQKAGRTEESLAAWRRSADIYNAIGLKDMVERLENQLADDS